MSREQVGKCPKCGGEMKPARIPTNFRILKSNDWYGDPAVAFYCQDCGFIELYKEPSTGEPRRRIRPRSEQEQPQQPVSTEEPQEPQERETKREIDKRLIR